MSFLRSMSRGFHLASRASGDLAALQSGGPGRLAKRVGRRRIVRAGWRSLGRLGR